MVYFLAGNVDEILFEARLVETDDPPHKADKKVINGLPNFKIVVHEHVGIDVSDMVSVARLGPDNQRMDLYNFPPGSVIAFRYVFPIEMFSLKISIIDYRCALLLLSV